MRNKQLASRYWIAGLLLGSLGSAPASAEMAINMHGNLIVPPCTVNGDAALAVDFGALSIDSIDPNDFDSAQLTTIVFDCPYAQGVPWVSLTGTRATGGGPATLATSLPNLGIEIMQGSTGYNYVNVNSGEAIASDALNGNQFTFRGVLWNGSGNPLVAGQFTATVTMAIHYQ